MSATLRRETVLAMVREQLQLYDGVYHTYRKLWDVEGMARIDHKLQALEKMYELLAKLDQGEEGDDDSVRRVAD